MLKHGNAWKGGKIKCNCKSCGKFCYKKKSEIKQGKGIFCSRSCTNKNRKAWNKGKTGYLAGKKHYNWKGGKSRYKRNHNGPYLIWITKVFERDNWTCQECGARNAKGRKKVYLEAHHIKPWAKFKLLRYTVSNGITYCLKCHCKIDPQRAKFIKKYS